MRPGDTLSNEPLPHVAQSYGSTCHTERWYVVHTQPHQERRAEFNLRNQGYRVFCPLRPKTIRHARRVQTVRAPFFPGYLFVHLDPNRDRWRAINGTYGVIRLISRGDFPDPVPRGIVETMIQSRDEHGVLRFVQHLKAGGRVRLLSGPFAEQLGILDRMDTSGSVRVLLSIMNGVVPVRTEAGNVITAAAPASGKGCP